jgi:hypothetical protein
MCVFKLKATVSKDTASFEKVAIKRVQEEFTY